MSDEIRDHVWRHSPFKGTGKLIHLAIADVVNEAHQWRYWGGDRWLADRVGCDRNTVLRWKAKALESGLLVENGFDPKTGNKEYIYVVPEQMSQNAASPAQIGDPMRHLRAPDATFARSSPLINRREQNKDKDSSSTTPLTLVAADPFDAFWSAYPRHQAKQAARKAWERAVRAVEADVIIQGAVRFAADPNREDEFTPHPATWLNQGRWDDDPLPARGKATSRTDPRRRGGPSLTDLRDAAFAADQRGER